MKPQPILFIDHAPALGGAEHSLLMLLTHLDRARFDLHLACAGGPLADRAAALGVPVYILPFSRLRRSLRAPLDMYVGVQALAHVAREIDAALLIANTVRTAFYTAPAARLTGIPFVWYRRDFWLGETRSRLWWLARAVKRLLCAMSVCMIANSQATADRHPGNCKIQVVHNGIDISGFDPNLDRLAFRQQYGIPAEALVLGMLGRLRPLKGHEHFLQIFDYLLHQADELPQAVWGVIVGGEIFGAGDYEHALREMATELGLEQQVVFTGYLEQPQAALAAMDIFVQPGDPEAFGLVNVEAMAMGKPLVAFANGALPEIVLDGKTGVLVPPGDETALREALLTLIKDPDLRARMGRAGRERVERTFTIEQTTHNLEAVLQQLLA